MKKTSILVASIAAVATNGVMAGTPNIKFQLRNDLVYDDGRNGAPDETSLETTYIRLDVKGKLADDLAYRVKFRLDKDFGSGKSHGTSSAINYAYIQKKIADGLKVKIGKQYINLGGFEGMFSSKEFYSQGSFTWNNADFYRNAVGAFYSFGDHSVNVQIANNDEDDSSKDFMYGAQALFSFADGMINPVVSYHQDTSHEDLAVGLQVKAGAVTVEADYLSTSHDDVAGAKIDDTESTTVFAKYKVGNWAPQFRYTMGESEKDEYDDFDSYHVGVEYYPYGNSSFRYHAIYAATDNEKTDGTEEESSTLTLGFALSY